MNILYFGTVCDLQKYEKFMSGCRRRPSVAPIVFENALICGLFSNQIDVEIYSYPMIPVFPRSRVLFFGNMAEKLPCGYTCHWLKTVNIPILKQWSRRMDAKLALQRWIRKNGTQGVILTYSIPPFLVKDITRLGKKYGIRTAAIVPDLLQNMYMNHQGNRVSAFFKDLYLKVALRYQGDYDGYIYLTEAMRDVVAPQKPYIVMEGIADLEDQPVPVKKAASRAVMYAGRLHEKYGIMHLLDAFELLREKDVELWLFGDGTAVPEIKNRASRDARIRYFGRVSREEILRYEKRAALLVNPRSVQDPFTKYSFPSKTIEYMYSGTPLITTRLQGIPEEYFDYVFSAADNAPSMLAEKMEEVLRLSEEERAEFGSRAKRFIAEQKNAAVQSNRIVDFLLELTGNTNENTTEI